MQIVLELYVLNFYMYMCFIHTVAAIYARLPATSNPKTVGRMCYAILGAIGLTSHYSTNYK